MAVRVRQQAYIQQPVLPEQPKQSPSIQKKKKRSKSSYFTVKEKFLYLAFIVVIAVLAVALLNTQGQIQTTTIEIQQLEAQSSEIAKQNVELKVQVSELSTYERIWQKAKDLGLSLNEKNVKVVPSE